VIALLPSAQIDHIQVTVYFNIVLPIGIYQFYGRDWYSHKCQSGMAYAGDENISLLNIQRKSGNEEWKTIKTLQTGVTDKERSYTYTDMGCTDQQAFYRLK